MTEVRQPIRRIVTIDDSAGRSRRLSDGGVARRVTTQVRPGFVSEEIWVAGASPVSLRDLDNAQMGAPTLEPPPGGSLCRIVTIPPDSAAGPSEVAAFFAALGSRGASTYSPTAPHPYMQKTRSLDFCVVLEGKITLVLDTQEVDLQEGDTVVQRGTNHAWSNRSSRPCILAVTMRDGLSER